MGKFNSVVDLSILNYKHFFFYLEGNPKWWWINEKEKAKNQSDRSWSLKNMYNSIISSSDLELMLASYVL